MDGDENRRHSQMGTGPRMSIHIDKDGIFTTAVLVGERFGAIGSAKRNPRDAFDAQVGTDIAMARAFRDLADQLEEEARRGE